MQTDFGQRRVEIGGVPQQVSFFVATLGYSRRIHVRAFADERREHWLKGMESAFAAFGGGEADRGSVRGTDLPLSEEVLLDNARALILSHDAASREVVVNPKLHAFARHWGFQVEACAPYRPRSAPSTAPSVRARWRAGKDERGARLREGQRDRRAFL